MDNQSESALKLVTQSPIVYSINLNDASIDDLYDVYANQILIAASATDVEKAMIEYTNTYIEPVGWKAIWRATKSTLPLDSVDVDCDFLVEVLDVSMIKMESTVKLLGIVEVPVFEILRNNSDFQNLLLAKNGEIIVPLTELHPLSSDDDEGFFLKTAVAIEYIRFFYENLWRPWDEEDDDDIVFAERHLKPRLKLYFDIQNGIVPETMARRVSEILEQAWILRDKLREFQMSDSEAEFEEADVIQTIEYRSELEDLQKQLELLENPTLRTLVMSSNNSSMISRLSTGGTVCYEREYPVLHLVGQNITLGSIKELSFDTNVVVRMYESPELAISRAQSGETVLIFPGTYKCLSLGWIEENVTVKGVGGLNEVVIEGCKGGGDIFLNCCASEIILENITLKPDRLMKTTVLIHKGSLLAKDCFVNGGDYGMIVLEGASLTLDNCNVLYSNIDGINMRLGSSLTMKSSYIHHCEGSGLRVDGESDVSFAGIAMDDTNEKIPQVSTLKLEKVQFYSNRCYGMIVDVKVDDPENENEFLDWNDLKSLSWLNLDIDDTIDEEKTFGCGNTKNGKGNLGKFSNIRVKSKHTALVSSPPPYDKFLDSISRIKFLSISSESDLVNCGVTNVSTTAYNGDDSQNTPTATKNYEVFES